MGDFTEFPMLAKYMESFWIFPRWRFRNDYQGWDWVCFRAHGGAYSTDWMVQAAIDRIYAKIEAYKSLDLHGKYGLQELILLCHYSDEALLHNTPIKKIGFGFPDVAKEVSKALEKDHGVFDRIFLYHPWESARVIRVF